MIEQRNLQSRIEQLIKDRTFPRFSILVGPKGSGKKTLAHEIGHMFNAWRVSSDYVDVYRLPDVKIDTVREIIVQAYKRVTTMVYIIPDADNMSNAAKNALLKVTEEPPNNAYFIMTLEDEHNTLETIRSRGTVFRMDRYTPDEILQFAEKDDGLHYVQLVIDNIAEVSLANAFKIPSKVALKDGVEGYDLKLFWKAFINICFLTQTYDKWGPAVSITSKRLQDLRVKGINKQMLMDNWILEVRDAWS